jgi:hypothetical protein
MKAISKLFSEFIAWRWASTTTLVVASLLYALVVLALVPDQIAIPIANAKFAPKPAATGTAGEPPPAEVDGRSSDPAPLHTVSHGDQPTDFGRRGFSPPLPRPDPPPAPPEPPPVMPPPPPAADPPPPPEAAPAPAEPAPEPSAAATPPSLPGRMGGILQNFRPFGLANPLAHVVAPPPSAAPEPPPDPN